MSSAMETMGLGISRQNVRLHLNSGPHACVSLISRAKARTTGDLNMFNELNYDIYLITMCSDSYYKYSEHNGRPGAHMVRNRKHVVVWR